MELLIVDCHKAQKTSKIDKLIVSKRVFEDILKKKTKGPRLTIMLQRAKVEQNFHVLASRRGRRNTPTAK